MYTTTGFIHAHPERLREGKVKIIMMIGPCGVDYPFIHFVPPAPPSSSSMPKAEHDILVPRAQMKHGDRIVDVNDGFYMLEAHPTRPPQIPVAKPVVLQG